jgi:uncharacterized protein YhaN
MVPASGGREWHHPTGNGNPALTSSMEVVMNISAIACMLTLGLASAYAQEQQTGTINDDSTTLKERQAVQQQANKAPEDKRFQTNTNADKKEGTVNLDRQGSWQAGAGARQTRPDHQKTEADKRQEQTNKGGEVFIRKTFP